MLLRTLFQWLSKTASDPILKSEWSADDYSKESMKLNARFALNRFPRDLVVSMYGEEFIRQAEYEVQ